MPFSAPVLTYRAKALASNMCSKVLNGHIILTDTSITTILAPEMTYTPSFTDLGYCLLAVQVHLPDVFFCKITPAAEAASTNHALVSLDAFAFSVLLYNGGIACRAFFCS